MILLQIKNKSNKSNNSNKNKRKYLGKIINNVRRSDRFIIPKRNYKLIWTEIRKTIFNNYSKVA